MTGINRPIAAVLAALALGCAPAAAATDTLKIATVVPAGTSFVEELKAAGATIAERTDGGVELKLFPGGVMGNARGVLRKIRIGQLHGAVITASALAMIDPAAQVYSMPFLFRSHDELEYVRKRMDPVIRKHVEGAGYVVTGISEGGFTYLFSKHRLERLEDLKKARVWVPQGDEITARMFENGGSNPVSLPVSDVYTSLQTGLIDTVAINPAGAIALQWHTGVDYYTDAPLLFLVGMMVIDKRVFDRLDDAEQEVVRDVLESTFDRLDDINRDDNREALKALEEQGIEAVDPARPPDQRRWEQIARETLERLEDAGKFDPAVLDRVRELVEQYRARHGG